MSERPIRRSIGSPTCDDLALTKAVAADSTVGLTTECGFDRRTLLRRAALAGAVACTATPIIGRILAPPAGATPTPLPLTESGDGQHLHAFRDVLTSANAVAVLNMVKKLPREEVQKLELHRAPALRPTDVIPLAKQGLNKSLDSPTPQLAAGQIADVSTQLNEIAESREYRDLANSLVGLINNPERAAWGIASFDNEADQPLAFPPNVLDQAIYAPTAFPPDLIGKVQKAVGYGPGYVAAGAAMVGGVVACAAACPPLAVGAIVVAGVAGMVSITLLAVNDFGGEAEEDLRDAQC